MPADAQGSRWQQNLAKLCACKLCRRGEHKPVVPPHATRVIVDPSINVILAHSFEGNPNIIGLYCHDGIEKVECGAFRDCPSLRLIIIPDVK
eukprot:scaffold37568_cov161-Skeletonema_dohrnii-CCMP3373.AAC.2